MQKSKIELTDRFKPTRPNIYIAQQAARARKYFWFCFDFKTQRQKKLSKSFSREKCWKFLHQILQASTSKKSIRSLDKWSILFLKEFWHFYHFFRFFTCFRGPRLRYLDFLTGEIFQEKIEPPRILSLYLKVWKLRDSQYRIYCSALHRCALNLEFSNCSPTRTSGGTGSKLPGHFRVWYSILDRHLEWRSLDPTLAVSSNFVKKKSILSMFLTFFF